MNSKQRRDAPAEVWGRDDLTCPVPTWKIRATIAFAKASPWPGNQPIQDRRHVIDTTAITEPGRKTRILFSLDVGYHQSGWFANSDYERCFHLSLSHPRPELTRFYRTPRNVDPLRRPYVGHDVETPTDEEARAWGRVLFREHTPKAWFEPAVGPLDPYRAPGVVHLRLYVDQAGRPIVPRGEVYDLLPFADGSSPRKVTEGRFGADVR
jgi:hypothetical protein